jgi:replication initiation and membrane attachment protein DnaB
MTQIVKGEQHEKEDQDFFNDQSLKQILGETLSDQDFEILRVMIDTDLDGRMSFDDIFRFLTSF